jgi:integrase
MAASQPRSGVDTRAEAIRRLEHTGCAATLPTIRFHDLRHTLGTMCAASGIRLTTVQAYMGHAHISTTMVYAHFAPAGNEAALISRAFGAATTMPETALPQAA